jgi:hypothetical protein
MPPAVADRAGRLGSAGASPSRRTARRKPLTDHSPKVDDLQKVRGDSGHAFLRLGCRHLFFSSGGIVGLEAAAFGG